MGETEGDETMTDDIVTRLRRDCISLIADEAADEIDRLRIQNATLLTERDEARRMACEKEETLGCDERGVPRNGSARDHAKQRGWDCFKENS
jgi:hypothetical protein